MTLKCIEKYLIVFFNGFITTKGLHDIKHIYPLIIIEHGGKSNIALLTLSFTSILFILLFHTRMSHSFML